MTTYTSATYWALSGSKNPLVILKVTIKTFELPLPLHRFDPPPFLTPP